MSSDNLNIDLKHLSPFQLTLLVIGINIFPPIMIKAIKRDNAVKIKMRKELHYLKSIKAKHKSHLHKIEVISTKLKLKKNGNRK